MPLETAFFFASALLLFALFLRAKIKLLQLYYVPAAIVGGIVGLLLLQVGLHAEAFHAGATWLPEFATAIVDEFPQFGPSPGPPHPVCE